MLLKRTLIQHVARERDVPGGRELLLTFRLGERGDEVPSVLLLPDGASAAPAALLLHGWSSRKEHMAESVGRALLARGMASLAVDLPLHGERSDAAVLRGASNPLALVKEWRAAVAEAGLALRYLAARAETDASRLGVVGYSLGSYLALTVAARDEGARAVVLAAGGDLPANIPFSRIVRTVADPIAQVRALAGRPLLMVHGRNDRTIRPDQAERLFEAAREPKAIQWWNAGHYLPQAAIDRAAQWLAERLAHAEAERG